MNVKFIQLNLKKFFVWNLDFSLTYILKGFLCFIDLWGRRKRIVISGSFFSPTFFKDCWTQQESKHQAQKLIFITLAPLEEEDRAQNLDVLDKSRLDPQ